MKKAPRSPRNRPFWLYLTLVFLVSVATTALTDPLADNWDPELGSDVDELQPVTVRADRVANQDPAGAMATPSTALRYDPQVDVQSRGIAEGQSDVTVRGGLFENTGFRVGAVTVFDPQTGHYVAQLPIDPTMLSGPQILTGIDNSIVGFNSSIATINYSWLPIENHREVAGGFGDDNLQYLALRFGQRVASTEASDYAVEVAYAGSSGNGTRPNGDHDFELSAAHLQRSTLTSQSDLYVGYQNNFYGWPGAYTGFANLAETDHTKTTLAIFNHRIDKDGDADSGFFAVGAFYRQLEDDYDFDRTTQEQQAPGSFDHETRSYGLGVQGMKPIGNWDWIAGLQLAGDELVRSTDLTNGRFYSRSYASLSVAPARSWSLSDETDFVLQLGATLDASNRDSNAVSPLLAMTWFNADVSGVDTYGVSYTAATQVPGYTALNSPTMGLFGGNPSLGREKARTLELSVQRERADWQASIAVFARRDKNLVDWTFLSGAPFARQANAVDLDVLGFETFYSRQSANTEWIAGTAYLDKDADYGTAVVDASYYALNFARWRATVALIQQLSPQFTLRWDNELRRQTNNVLRNSSSRAYMTSAALSWASMAAQGLSVSLIVDNLTNSNFQEFPGTPSARRQVSVMASYDW